jgi:hypothetical protein
MASRAKLLSLCLFLGSSIAASPAEAGLRCVFQDAYVFTDPSYTGALIGTIPAPAPVELVRLGPKWSLISYDGESGYVATRHLIRNSGAAADPPPGDDYGAAAGLRRDIDPQTLMNWPYPGARFGLGSRWSDPTFYAGLRGSHWTSRTHWRRTTYRAPNDPAWSVCSGPAVKAQGAAGSRLR